MQLLFDGNMQTNRKYDHYDREHDKFVLAYPDVICVLQRGTLYAEVGDKTLIVAKANDGKSYQVRFIHWRWWMSIIQVDDLSSLDPV